MKIGLRICFSCTCMLSMKKARHTDNCASKKFFLELFKNRSVRDGEQAIKVAIVVIFSWSGRSHELTFKYLMPQWFKRHQNVATLLSNIPRLIGKILYKISFNVAWPPLRMNGAHTKIFVKTNTTSKNSMCIMVLKRFYLYRCKSNASAYTPKGSAKYKDICLKLMDSTIATVARAIFPFKIKAIAQSTRPCITWLNWKWTLSTIRVLGIIVMTKRVNGVTFFVVIFKK